MQRFLFTPLLFMATWLAAHPVEITTVDTCNFDLLIQLEPSVPGNTYCPGDVVILSVQSGLDAYNWYYNYTGDPDDNQLIASDVNVIAIDISFFGFGYFSVEATDDGCTELSDPVLIDSYAFLLPVIASDGTTEFCAGDSTTIWYPSPGGAFFQWELNGNPIPGATDSVYQVTQPGTYTLSMSYEVCPNNFFNSGVGPTFSTLTPIPTEIIVDPGLGISGLSASTGTVVQWYLNELPIPGATQPTYVADTDGLYQVEVIDAQGCTVFSPPLQVFIESVKALPNSSVVQLYPNPAGDYLQIEASGEQLQQIILTDITGRVLSEVWPEGSSRYTLDLSALPVGTIICRITLANQTQHVERLLRME